MMISDCNAELKTHANVVEFNVFTLHKSTFLFVFHLFSVSTSVLYATF